EWWTLVDPGEAKLHLPAISVVVVIQDDLRDGKLEVTKRRAGGIDTTARIVGEQWELHAPDREIVQVILSPAEEHLKRAVEMQQRVAGVDAEVPPDGRS